LNPEHLRAFLWLRWRLRVNQLTRGGIVNVVLLAFVTVSSVLLAVVLFIVGFLVGLLLLPQASPVVLTFVWDGLVFLFLFGWMIGLLQELQRPDVLSLDKFLHLPVSLLGAFLVNYVSSLLSFSMLVFGSAMVGLTLGLVFGMGPAMVLLFPLLAAFVLMVTALTYQFQGWLASLMVNPRRRRTVIVVVTASFILMCQLPNLVNLLRPWKDQADETTARLKEEQAEIQRAWSAKEITAEEYQQRQEALRRGYMAQKYEANLRTWHQGVETGRFLNVVLPPGWLPAGAMGLAEGHVLTALLGTVGLTLIGTASLWRAYGTTVRLYKGELSGEKRAPPAGAPPAKRGKPPPNLLEKELPWLSEQASAVALGAFRSLLRAPEGKMLLLPPAILVVVFGSILLAHQIEWPETVLPLLAFGAMSLILLTLIGIAGNQFGFDRGGFRVFVLSPAPRRDILLGKNLAIAPITLALGLGQTAILEVLYPMRFDHFLAVVPEFLSMHLLYCLLANLLSIFAPMHIAPGSFKPTSPKLIPQLFQVFFLFLLPFVLMPALLPLGVELLVEWLGGVRGLPICLALSLVECLAVVFFYRLVLPWQGRLLQVREQRILELVTTKAE
jgi:ABC-2 type transport system permease protein